MADREKVIRAVETCFDSWIDKHRNMGLDLHEVERVKREALEILKAPEIIRCAECKYWHTNCMENAGRHGCDVIGDYTGPDYYCASAERR